MVRIPDEYIDREQSFLKHRVLKEYVAAWGAKLGSLARQRSVRLCYVDAFAGPWNNKNKDLKDTSIFIALEALENALSLWTGQGLNFEIEAAFVERDSASFDELKKYLDNRQGAVRTRRFHGEFGDFVNNLREWMGTDPAFIFVDPTGWKGAAMSLIAPLMTQPRRDVLVNFMENHIVRFKNDERSFLRKQMQEFFGLGEDEMPPELEAEQLLALYRTNLKRVCGVKLAADLVIPFPNRERTQFRLVVGGSDPAVLKLFRDIEKKVMGLEAAEVRDAAKNRKRDGKSGQQPLLLSTAPEIDAAYDALRKDGLAKSEDDIVDALITVGETTFGELWPNILERRHITKVELGRVVWALHEKGVVIIDNVLPRQKTANDEHRLRATSRSPVDQEK